MADSASVPTVSRSEQLDADGWSVHWRIAGTDHPLRLRDLIERVELLRGAGVPLNACTFVDVSGRVHAFTVEPEQ